MDITKVLNLSESEINAVMQTGKILKDVEESLTSSASDELNPDNIALIRALSEVVNSVLNFNKKEF